MWDGMEMGWKRKKEKDGILRLASTGERANTQVRL
jgi:hypothetical protein